jgi:hypothetical protein
LDEGLDVGEDTGAPVTPSYDVPFKFAGKVRGVTRQATLPVGPRHRSL